MKTGPGLSLQSGHEAATLNGWWAEARCAHLPRGWALGVVHTGLDGSRAQLLSAPPSPSLYLTDIIR